MINYFKYKNDIGKLIILIGLLTLLPVIIIPFYLPEKKYFLAFFIPSCLSVLIGSLICHFIKSNHTENNYVYTKKRGSLTVLFAWLYGIFIGAFPFMFLNEYNFLHCLFESASGWTTTGFTVMDVTTLPQIFLFHRSYMQFCGGLGFILVMIMIIQNKHSMNLYNSEGHSDQLTPSIIKTARTIFLLYIIAFILGIILYTLAGMPFFESIIHCMSALSTGGFSNKPGSIGDYNSVLIESITILIMLLGMTNFAVLLLLTKKKFKQVSKVSEIKFFGILLIILVPIITLTLFYGLSWTFGKSFRNSIFTVISLISTSGFLLTNYAFFPSFALGIIIILMLIGGSGGSTSGGLKLNRTYLLFRSASLNIRKKVSSEDRIIVANFHRAQGKTEIDNNLIKDTYTYAFLYFLIFVFSALLLCLSANASLADAIFEAASLTGTAGITCGIFTPLANNFTLVIGIIGMIIARLEINIILTAIFSS